MPKDITLLKYSFNPHGGLEKQALLIAKAFLDKGYRVSLFTTSQTAKNFPLGINWICKKKGPPSSLFRLFYWNFLSSRFVKKTKPSIVLALDRTTSQTHLRAGNGVHRAYLENRRKTSSILKKLSLFLNPLHSLIIYLEKKAFTNPGLKKIFVNSHMVKTEVHKYYQIPDEKISVIHNGVEWEKNQIDFNFWEEKQTELLKHFNLEKKHIFLFCGNGYERKGLKLLLKALSLLEEDFYLLIIGKDKKLKKYEASVKKLHLDKKILFLGFQADLVPFYQISDTFVLPSHYDPFANTTLESLSFGLFNITSSKNGAHEIINKENGIVLEELNEKSLLFALKQALKFPKTISSSLKIRNSVKYLDIKNQLNKLIDCIHE